MPIFEAVLDDGRTIHIDADDHNAALAGAQHFLTHNPPANTNQGLPPIPDGYQLEQPAQQKSQTYTFTSPTGTKHSVTGPAGSSPEEAFGYLQHYLGQSQNLPPLPPGFELEQPQDAPVTRSGLAKAVGAGVAKGVYDIPGDMTTLWNLGARGLAKLANVAGVPNSEYDPAKDDVHMPDWYNKGGEAVDNLYKPKNSTEDWAKYLAGFAPAIATGPEEFLGKGAANATKVLAKRALLQAALPAAASSAAGAATAGTDVEPYARVGAALLAGGIGVKGTKEARVTAADVGAQADKDFDAFRSAPVTIDPNTVSAAARYVQNDLKGLGLAHVPANNLVDHYINGTTAVPLNDLQTTRSLLNKAAKQADTPEGFAAIQARKTWDTLLDNLSPANTVTGANALPDAMAALRSGQKNTFVKKQLQAIEGAQYSGEINAATALTPDNTGNALQKRIGALLKSQQAMNRLQQYRPDMERIAKGGVAVKALRSGASLMGGADFHSNPSWLGALLAADLGAGGLVSTGIAALPLAAKGLKKIESNITGNRLDALKAKIATNARGLPPRTPGTSPWMTQALISTLAAQGNGGQ